MIREKESLIKIYNICDKSITEIEKEFPDQSRSTIKKLKTSFSKFRRDEHENLEFIKKNKDKLTTKEFDKHFKFADPAFSKIKIIFDIDCKDRPNSFSDKEKKFIKENYGKLSTSECAIALGMSKRRLVCYASENGILGKKAFSNDDVKEIKRLRKLGYTASEISTKMDRSVKSIYNYIYSNNLKLNQSKSTSNRFKPSAPELYIINKMSKLLNINFPDKTKKVNRSYYWNVVEKYEIDLPIYIDNLKFAIEYDGAYWHKDKERDNKKTEALKKAGFILFRISSNDHKANLKTLDITLKQLAINIMDLVKHSELTGNPLETNAPSYHGDIDSGSWERQEVW